jgi:hypothetical protein
LSVSLPASISKILARRVKSALGKLRETDKRSPFGSAEGRARSEVSKDIKRDVIFISHPSQKARRMGHPLVS